MCGTRVRRLAVLAALGLTLIATTAVAPAASEPRATTAARVPAVQGAVEAQPQPSLCLFRAWLAAFNSGDRARYAKFLKRNFPTRVPTTDADMGFRDFTGGFVLRKLIQVSVTRVSGWVPLRTVVLTRTDRVRAAGVTYVWSGSAEFALKVPAGTKLRATLPLSQAKPCYAAGSSEVLQT